MHNLSAHELGGHPLVRLIDEDHKSDDDDSTIRKAILLWLDEHRDEAVPLLLKLATDCSLLYDRALANGEVPVVATYLLERFDEPGIVPALLELLVSLPDKFPEQMQWHSIWETLEGFKDYLAEPAIKLYKESTEPRHRTIIARLLGDLDIEDPRVFDILIRELPSSPCLISTYLARRSDERALPALLAAFDRHKHTECGEFGELLPGQPMFDICEAVGALNGDLNWAQWQRYDRAWWARTPRQPSLAIVPPYQRGPATERLSRLPPAQITATTLVEFCQKAMLIYGSLRHAADSITTPVARLWHLTYFDGSR